MQSIWRVFVLNLYSSYYTYQNIKVSLAPLFSHFLIFCLSCAKRIKNIYTVFKKKEWLSFIILCNSHIKLSPILWWKWFCFAISFSETFFLSDTALSKCSADHGLTDLAEFFLWWEVLKTHSFYQIKGYCIVWIKKKHFINGYYTKLRVFIFNWR